MTAEEVCLRMGWDEFLTWYEILKEEDKDYKKRAGAGKDTSKKEDGGKKSFKQQGEEARQQRRWDIPTDEADR